MTKGSDLLVAALENEGVDRIFGVPGEENLDVVESLRKSTIELVLTRHEQSAAFMAATYGRLTGRPGVCMSTLGPGRAEPRDRRRLCASGRDADDPDHRPEGDHEQPAGPLPDRRHGRDDEAADQVDAPDRQYGEHPHPGARRFPRGDGGAARAGSSGVAGGYRGRGSSRSALVPPHPIELPVAQPAALDRAADMILKARAAAGDARRRGQPPAPERRADRFRRAAPQIPFFNTQMGKGTVAGGHPISIDGHSGALRTGLCARGDRPGRPDHRDRSRHGREAAVPDGAVTGRTVIHVGYTPANVEQVYFPHAEVVGDVGPSLALLADRLEGKLPNASGARLPLREGILGADHRRRHRRPLPADAATDRRRCSCRSCRTTASSPWTTACTRSGSPGTTAPRVQHPAAGQRAGDDGSGPALGDDGGACCIRDRRVLAVCGDGGFMMNSQELETAVRLETRTWSS